MIQLSVVSESGELLVASRDGERRGDIPACHAVDLRRRRTCHAGRRVCHFLKKAGWKTRPPLKSLSFVPLCLCAFVPLCLCAFVPLCLCAF